MHGVYGDETIEEKPRHSRAMVRFFRLMSVQRWPEDWLRNVQIIFAQVLRAPSSGDNLGNLRHTSHAVTMLPKPPQLNTDPRQRGRNSHIQSRNLSIDYSKN